MRCSVQRKPANAEQAPKLVISRKPIEHAAHARELKHFARGQEAEHMLPHNLVHSVLTILIEIQKRNMKTFEYEHAGRALSIEPFRGGVDLDSLLWCMPSEFWQRLYWFCREEHIEILYLGACHALAPVRALNSNLMARRKRAFYTTARVVCVALVARPLFGRQQHQRAPTKRERVEVTLRARCSSKHAPRTSNFAGGVEHAHHASTRRCATPTHSHCTKRYCHCMRDALCVDSLRTGNPLFPEAGVTLMATLLHNAHLKKVEVRRSLLTTAYQNAIAEFVEFDRSELSEATRWLSERNFTAVLELAAVAKQPSQVFAMLTDALPQPIAEELFEQLQFPIKVST